MSLTRGTLISTTQCFGFKPEHVIFASAGVERLLTPILVAVYGYRPVITDRITRVLLRLRRPRSCWLPFIVLYN